MTHFTILVKMNGEFDETVLERIMNRHKKKWDWWVIGGRWSNDIIEGDVKKVKELTPTEIKNIGENIYAVADIRSWSAPGEIGWFGYSSATPTQEKRFAKQIYSKFLKNAKPNTTLVVVDAHGA